MFVFVNLVNDEIISDNFYPSCFIIGGFSYLSMVSNQFDRFFEQPIQFLTV